MYEMNTQSSCFVMLVHVPRSWSTFLIVGPRSSYFLFELHISTQFNLNSFCLFKFLVYFILYNFFIRFCYYYLHHYAFRIIIFMFLHIDDYIIIYHYIIIYYNIIVFHNIVFYHCIIIYQ